MPALPQVAAIIDDGVVVNVAALSTENDYTDWLETMRAAHDDVRIVDAAGIGWGLDANGDPVAPEPEPEPEDEDD